MDFDNAKVLFLQNNDILKLSIDRLSNVIINNLSQFLTPEYFNSVYINKIKGKTIWWHLILDESKYSGIYGMTATIDGHIVKVSGTSTKTDNSSIMSNYQTLLANNTYLFHVKIYKNTASLSVCLNNWGNLGGIGYDSPQGGYYIFTPTVTAENVRITITHKINTVCDLQYSANLFNLTKMFGIGNEPTAELFLQMFPEDYYEKNDGELISVLDFNIELQNNLIPWKLTIDHWDVNDFASRTSGKIEDEIYTAAALSTTNIDTSFNILSKGTISLQANKIYYISFDCFINSSYYFYFNYNEGIKLYDVNLKTYLKPTEYLYIKSNLWGRYIIPIYVPTTSEYKLLIGADSCNLYGDGVYILIKNILLSLNSTLLYYSYIESVFKLINISTILDSNGNQLFLNGLLSAGNIYDEITSTKAIKRIGSIDLGTLTWTKIGTSEFSCTTSSILKNNQFLCTRYNFLGNTITWSDMKDLYIASVTTQNWIWIMDSNYDDLDKFVESLLGVILYYGIETPIEVAVDLDLSYTTIPGNANIINFLNTDSILSYPYLDIVYNENLTTWERTENLIFYDYIESTGTQYINIEIGFDNTDLVEAKAMVSTSEGGDKFFVSAKTWNNNNNRFAMGLYPSLTYCIGYGGYGTSNTPMLPSTSNDGNQHIWIYKDKIFTIPELELSRDVSNIPFGGTTDTLLLFYGYNAPTKAKMSYYKHYKDGQLVRYMLPCTYLEEPGMWDIVENKFYGNSGTGTFIVGNN